jgi:hypothetical protein
VRLQVEDQKRRFERLEALDEYEEPAQELLDADTVVGHDSWPTTRGCALATLEPI